MVAAQCRYDQVPFRCAQIFNKSHKHKDETDYTSLPLEKSHIQKHQRSFPSDWHAVSADMQQFVLHEFMSRHINGRCCLLWQGLEERKLYNNRLRTGRLMCILKFSFTTNIVSVTETMDVAEPVFMSSSVSHSSLLCTNVHWRTRKKALQRHPKIEREDLFTVNCGLPGHCCEARPGQRALQWLRCNQWFFVVLTMNQGCGSSGLLTCRGNASGPVFCGGGPWWYDCQLLNLALGHLEIIRNNYIKALQQCSNVQFGSIKDSHIK